MNNKMETLAEEQVILDNHGDRISNFMDRLLCLMGENAVEEIKLTVVPTKSGPSRQISKRL